MPLAPHLRETRGGLKRSATARARSGVGRETRSPAWLRATAAKASGRETCSARWSSCAAANMSSGLTPPRSMSSCARRRTCPAARRPRAGEHIQRVNAPLPRRRRPDHARDPSLKNAPPGVTRRRTCLAAPRPRAAAELREAANMSGGPTPARWPSCVAREHAQRANAPDRCRAAPSLL